MNENACKMIHTCYEALPAPVRNALGECCICEPGGPFQIVDVLAEEPLSEPEPQGVVKAVPWDGEPPAKADTTEFSVTVERGPGQILGLELDLLDGLRALVCDVKPGIVADYNAKAPLEAQIKSRDWIIEVNGVRDSSKYMHHKLKSASKIDMLVRRSQPSSLTLKQDSNRRIAGCLKGAAGGNAISWLIFDDDGDVIREHNRANPKKALKKHDRIVEVNGVAGNTAQMMDQLRKANQLELIIVSPGDD
jgi:hypothetical protein